MNVENRILGQVRDASMGRPCLAVILLLSSLAQLARAQAPVRVEGEVTVRNNGGDLLRNADLVATPDGTYFLAWSLRDPNNIPISDYGMFFDRHGNAISDRIGLTRPRIGRPDGGAPDVSINSAGEVVALSNDEVRRIGSDGVIVSHNMSLESGISAVVMGPDRVFVFYDFQRAVRFLDFTGSMEILPPVNVDVGRSSISQISRSPWVQIWVFSWSGRPGSCRLAERLRRRSTVASLQAMAASRVTSSG